MYIDLCETPKFELHCTGRGVKGEIYASRVYKENEDMMEYYIYNSEKKKFEWINDNGYCKFNKIKNV